VSAHITDSHPRGRVQRAPARSDLARAPEPDSSEPPRPVNTPHRGCTPRGSRIEMPIGPIEEGHRQLKCFWDMTRFTSRTFSLVLNQIVFVLLAYNLLQIFLRAQSKPPLSRRSRSRQLDLAMTTAAVIIYLRREPLRHAHAARVNGAPAHPRGGGSQEHPRQDPATARGTGPGSPPRAGAIGQAPFRSRPRSQNVN
jgi:hypothetical protein